RHRQRTVAVAFQSAWAAPRPRLCPLLRGRSRRQPPLQALRLEMVHRNLRAKGQVEAVLVSSEFIHGSSTLFRSDGDLSTFLATAEIFREGWHRIGLTNGENRAVTLKHRVSQLVTLPSETLPM